MITRHTVLNQMPDYSFEKDYDINKILFFDIETTGFAADASYLYLIGCAYYQDGTFQLIQWFSEHINEEVKLIQSFLVFLNDYEVLIHYNGTGFDLPYLQKKILTYELDYSFQSLISVDIYKKIVPLKKVFHLNSLKLKAVENYLNIKRIDTFDGGDLIQVYQSYLGKKHFESLWNLRNPLNELPRPTQSEQYLEQLLLHNADDIRGLLSVSLILNYVDLFDKPFRVLEAKVEALELKIRFEINSFLPVPISYGNDLVHLNAHETIAMLTVQIYEGELKYFYQNYSDYYYLPAEDYAIHKSVANFVDKEFRKKAKPSNCYTRKQGLFAPQYEPVITPYFKMKYQDKLTFLDIHTDFLLQEEHLEQYVKHLLGQIL